MNGCSTQGLRWLTAATATAAALSIANSATLAPVRAQTGDSPLIEAARIQDVDAVRSMLAEGADVNARQADESTALHWAVHWEHQDTVELLIRAGADVNAANDLATTPLVMASASGNGAIVEALLAAGADANAARASGETALMLAARTGSLLSVSALLAAGAEVNAVESTRGQSALMWASANAHPDVVDALLDHGANVKARSSTGSQVFNMGGSRSAGSASSGIALEEVPQGGSTPLLFAVRSGDLESARLLIAAGADVNDSAADGNTALVIAAHSGSGSVAALLLEQGADPNVAPLGYTALHAAVLRGTLRDRRRTSDDPGAGVPLVRALLEHGANPDALLAKGTPVRRWSHDFALMGRWVGATPYWLAAKFLEVEMMRVLVAGGADPRRASRDGTTPLMAAAGLGYSRGGGSAFIKDRRDFSSYNPVESAAQGSQIPADEERLALVAVTTALELGADVRAVDQAGNTALHAAASHGMDTLITTLVNHGADVRASNTRGQTPAALAVYSDGIGGDRRVREGTASLLGALENTAHPAEPHRHAEARILENPVATSSASVTAGAAVYASACAACHGPTGRGDGRLSAATAAYGRRPPNLIDAIWQHGASDGEIFIAIRDGFATGQDVLMDAFRDRITETETWHLVNYLRGLR
jgi:ankyrin repeat protein